MAKNEQWSITFDAYSRFVIGRFKGIFGDSRSAVVNHIIQSWVSDHPDQVSQAGASIRDWRKQRSKRR